MSTQVKSTSPYDTKANRFKEDKAQLSDSEKKELCVKIGDSYLTEEGVKTKVTKETIADARSLVNGSGTIIYKNTPSNVPLTVYYKSSEGTDILMDGGYLNSVGGVTNYTNSEKDDTANIEFSGSARARFWHDSREDVSEAQLGTIEISKKRYEVTHQAPISYKEAEDTLKILVSAESDKKLTSDEMVERLGELDMKYGAYVNDLNNDNIPAAQKSPPLTKEETKERQALGRIIHDLGAWQAADKNHDENFTLNKEGDLI
jgi:hypothetical protein